MSIGRRRGSVTWPRCVQGWPASRVRRTPRSWPPRRAPPTTSSARSIRSEEGRGRDSSRRGGAARGGGRGQGGEAGGAGRGEVVDPVETCTGPSADCPLDMMKTSADVCRAAAGECDLAEMCPGVAGQPCPPDAKKLAATPCTADDKFCTLDQCDGSNVTCQHPPGHAGEACRRGSGALCDPDQPCTGTRP